ncbi:MAG: alpha/beta hydrolase [Propionicimonas sp.]|nr:alpha/beta hydrolase [Propionicimonas sp.]MEA5119398.1 alpha/beta hydrolase [Propionicimonas sp.]
MDASDAAPAHPQTRHEIALPSAEVSYLEWAPPEPERTLLLLHGGGVDSASLSWGGVGPELAAAGYRVIAPDHPGYGSSPLPDWSSSQERLVGYVGEFVAALDLGGYAVGGLSMGGGMTIGHLLDRPEKITGAIPMGSYGFMERLGEGRFAGLLHWLTWASVQSGFLDLATRWYSGKRSRMDLTIKALIADPARRDPALLDEVWQAVQSGEGSAAFSQWQKSEYGRKRAKTVYLAQLPSVTTPVLLVHGENDPGVPVARARLAASLLPHGRLVEVPGAAHWVQRERPDIVVPALLDFLAGLDWPAGSAVRQPAW